ncbi:acyltransferase [Butyrivibrio sp. JL13D10]|uniref:acyltransferase n=1 Tax=Butyrivibrio sp. JL13D10 TaxID=3236815 RepID=UPI0038B52F97
MKYFLILAAVFSFNISWCIQIVEDTVSVSFIIKMTRVFKEFLTTMSLDVIMGYSFYYILGYYVDNIVISKKTRRLIYLLGVNGFVVTAVLEWIVAIKTNEPHQHCYNNFSVNVALEAIAVFTWFKYHDFKITKLHGVIETISKYCFGAYLVHALIIEIFEWPLGITAISFNPPVAVLIMGTMVFASSIIISAILNHIPYVGKYLV